VQLERVRRGARLFLHPPLEAAGKPSGVADTARSIAASRGVSVDGGAVAPEDTFIPLRIAEVPERLGRMRLSLGSHCTFGRIAVRCAVV
jgi:hypothetical protein